MPTNLPTVRTELIGRSEELTALCALVDREQLVTLTGVGGVGKTRLALGVAGILASRYPDGCWLVELAPVADGAEVTKAFVAMIAAPAMGTEALARFLADRRLLVVLDNCEHLIGDVAELVDSLLGAAPDLHVLATSREPLGLDGEHVRRVQSLRLPAADAHLAEAVETAAVRLFIDRATAVAEGFVLNDANRGAVVEICRHLDGIPLAIELAAARVRAMPPAEIATRLGERFRLLTGGSRRAQERHRTLAATVGWSYDLLSDEERAVFRRLSVFPASFDLAAAEAVAGDGPIDVLDDLVHLVDRSLVQYEPGSGRYRLLETLRQYGADRLAEAGETDAARGRHGRHFIDLAASMAPQLLDARQHGAAAALTVELDNLRAVADWCMGSGRATDLARFGEDLWMFLNLFAPVDAAEWYRYLSQAPDGLDARSARRAGGYFAMLAVNSLGDFPGALAAAEQALDGGDAPSEEPPCASLARCMVAIYTTRDPSGLMACQRALAAADAQGDEAAACTALGMLGNWLAEAGDRAASDHYAIEAVERAQRTGNPELVTAGVVCAAANYLWTSTEPDFARSFDMLSRYDTGSHPQDAARTLWYDLQLGTTLDGLGKPGARRHLIATYRLADRQAALHAQDLTLRILALHLAKGGDFAGAARLLGYSDANFRPFRIETPVHAWLERGIDTAMGQWRDRAEHEAAGRGASRHQIIALLNDLEMMTPTT